MDENKKTPSAFSKIIDVISGIFLPILPILMGSAILKGLLMLLLSLGVFEETSGIYRTFYAASDTLFYFMPVFLAYTSAKKLKADPFIAMAIAGALLYPDLASLLTSEESSTLLGLKIPSVNYSSSVIPIILAVILLHFVELPLDKYIPKIICSFLKPLICLIIVLPATLLVFGPIGIWIGNLMANAFSAVYSSNPVIAGALFGLVIQPMVVLGCHWSIIPISVANIAATGGDPILPLLGGAVFGQAGAAFAVGLMLKDSKEKSMAFSASLTAVLGVTEPAIFGVNLTRVRPMVSACIAGGIGGAIAGLSNARAVSFAFPGLTTLVIYYGEGFGLFMLSMAAGFVAGFALTMLQKGKIKNCSNNLKP